MSMLSFSNTPLWEKVVGFVGVALIAVTIGFLLWSALNKSGTPPNIEVEVNDIILVSGHYLVQVTVRNRGDQTAENLQMEARLALQNDTPEKITVQVNYLAPGSKEELGFYFTEDPASGELAFRPLGFQVP